MSMTFSLNKRRMKHSKLYEITVFTAILFFLVGFMRNNCCEWNESTYKSLGIHPLPAQLFGAPDPSKFHMVDIIDTEYIIENIINKVADLKFKVDEGSGNGIVILGHNNVIYELIALIKYIVSFSQTPIELFYADDIDDKYMEILQKLPIKIVNLSSHPLYQNKISNDRKYYLKPLAMMATSFENVIYLDSDCFPLLHLSSNILEISFSYLESFDAVYFRDYWMMTPENPLYTLLDISYLLQRQVDSSVVIYKKTNTAEVLLMSYFICLEPHFDYYLFGDKDSYWFSSLLLRLNHPEMKSPRILLNPEMSGFVGDLDCGVGMLHILDTNPAFLHLNGFKSRLQNGLPDQKPVFCELASIKSRIPLHRLKYMTIGKSKNDDLVDDGTQAYSLYDDKGQCVKSQSEGMVKEMDNSIILEKYKESFMILKSTC
eukprot:NODE_39_length_29903_cov_0.529057.p6 type:complete len:430 gc:universal NODE_39_length_29903_cov_0.529057:6896-5607(-)